MAENSSTESWTAELVVDADGRHALHSPHLGWWRGSRAPGSGVLPGIELGRLDVLGVVHRVLAPDGATGAVIHATSHGGVAVAVGYRDLLVTLEPGTGSIARSEHTAANATADDRDGLVFRTSMSGRFYSRPSPDKPAYADEGQVIQTGETVGLLEVMKTFTRLTYGGPQLPATARIARIVPSDGDDLNAGDVVLELEPAG